MNSVDRVKVVSELYELLNEYACKRDLPVDESTANFFEKVKRCCDLLDLDYDECKKEFGLKESHEFLGK
ncbi:hypothetical protein LOK74_04640 [Brevibacillus humidisoli]|uniref:hypothetical protein n=1 Tax=Brevibacillus humidisoli TaxID=2895522 RepID=UPI001E2AA859|nr:hypothetical protein [Brevibacillus humidisoli]UFJ41795.1 hypothetical protein LOK74_04640 [Brevibacillus humidisoli]